MSSMTRAWRAVWTIGVFAWCSMWGVAASWATSTHMAYYRVSEAYAAGDGALARELAVSYLAQYRAEYARAQTDSDREGALTRILGTVRTVLHHESQQGQGQGLGKDSALMRIIDEDLALGKKHLAEVPNDRASSRKFIQSEIGRAAVDLLRFRAATSSRRELEQIVAAFRSEIEAVGQSSVDSILAPAPSPAATAKSLSPVAPADSTRISAVIHDYLEGLAEGDTAKLASATGLRSEEIGAAIARYKMALAEAGIAQVTMFAVPSGTELTSQIRLSPNATEEFVLYLNDLAVEVLLQGNGRDTRRWNWQIRLRRDAAGRWLIIVPR
jgi:hypothetical protein